MSDPAADIDDIDDNDDVAETDAAPVIPADPLVKGGRIVVGVDDSRDAAIALRWALREAIVREARLEVVHAWQMPVSALPWGGTLVLPVDEAELDEAARRNVDELVDAAIAELDVPAPEVVRTALPGPAVPTLLDISADADLLVVGSHGRTGLRRLVMGSVATAVVQHAACPVVLIRLPEE
jgi:nucleotide-binding universal stress UspA family protein